MNTEQSGSFRTRTADDGSLEVWARGWRLESQLYAVIPMALSLMFLVAPMSLSMRAVGAIVMLGAALLVFRMTKPGLWLTGDAVSIVSVVRRQRFVWEQVSGFMGERSHDEARILLILEDQQQIPLPGTLDPAELDPYGDEGQELSAADQLNQLMVHAVAGDLPKPAAPVVRVPSTMSDNSGRKEQRRERKELRAALKAVQLTPEGTPQPIPLDRALDPPLDDPSRKERRSERRRLRAALKAVQLTPEGTHVAPEPPASGISSPGRSSRRSRRQAAPELLEVAISAPEPASEAAPSRPKVPTGPPSPYPAPVYIPQAEYAQMLRDQKAAEKAAAAAAAELGRLADLDIPDDLAEKEEFSDWTS